MLDLLEHKKYDLSNLSTLAITASAFDSTEPENIDVLSLFVQTGYLTIKDYRNSRYSLDFPNYEVKRSFFDSVATRYSHLEKGVGDAYIYDLVDYLNAGRLDDFFKILKIFFANIPYELAVDREKYYQSLFYAIITMIGLSVEAEVSTNDGRIGTQTSARSLCSYEMSPRMGEGSTTGTFNNINTSINCVMQTADTIYVIEFKLNGTKENALKQIQVKQYAQKYLKSDKAIVLLGVEFDQQTRNIGEYLSDEIKQRG